MCLCVEPVDLAQVLDLLDARDLPVWKDLDVCPRTCPSANAQLCTYERWFARPTTLRNVALLYELPMDFPTISDGLPWASK